jgi:hypothetical protein
MKNDKNKPGKKPIEDEEDGEDKKEGTGSYIGGHFEDDENDNGGAEEGQYEELDDNENPGQPAQKKKEIKK